jgi:hypothetical protein
MTDDRGNTRYWRVGRAMAIAGCLLVLLSIPFRRDWGILTVGPGLLLWLVGVFVQMRDSPRRHARITIWIIVVAGLAGISWGMMKR